MNSYDAEFLLLSRYDNLISSTLMSRLFVLYDNKFTDGQISRSMKTKGYTLTFDYSPKDVESGGHMNTKNKNLTLWINSGLIDNLCFENNKFYMFSRLECRDKISCFLRLFEHEFSHVAVLLIFEKKGHCPKFRQFMSDNFGHSETFHHLKESGNYTKAKIETEKEAKKKIKGGDIVGYATFGGEKFIKVSAVRIKTLTGYSYCPQTGVTDLYKGFFPKNPLYMRYVTSLNFARLKYSGIILSEMSKQISTRDVVRSKGIKNVKVIAKINGINKTLTTTSTRGHKTFKARYGESEYVIPYSDFVCLA